MRIFSPFAKLRHAMLGNLTDAGKTWASIGMIVLGVAMMMSYDFGLQVSWKHAMFLAGLTFVAAFGPEVAYKAYQERRYGVAGFTAVFAALLLSIQLGVDQSYTAGIRGKNKDETSVQNTRYSGAQDDVKRNSNELTMLMSVLEGLQKDAPWAATVKADGLRSQVATLEKSIAEEGNARNGGCKRRCLDLMKQKTDAEAKIATAEKVEDTQKRIAELQGAIDRKRDTANKTEYKSSAVVHANAQIAKTLAFFGAGELDPSRHIEEGTDIGTNMAMAIAATGVPAFAFFIAGLYRKPEDETTLVGDLGNRTPETRAYPDQPAPRQRPQYALSTQTVGDLRRLAAA